MSGARGRMPVYTARRASSLLVAAAVAVWMLSAIPAAAQDWAAVPIAEAAIEPVPLPAWIESTPAIEPVPQLPPSRSRATPESDRPRALLPLYASLIALQGLDIHSTRSALSRGGAREANPLMRPIVKDSAAFLATKAAATAGVIWASEKLWKKKNRRVAVILASLVNTAMAAVVAHNYRVNR